jgi:hypothetical protein
MTQKEVDVVFSITSVIFEDKWFKEKTRTRDEVQKWVAKQLAEANETYTIPIGMSWGVLCNKESYEKGEYIPWTIE